MNADVKMLISVLNGCSPICLCFLLNYFLGLRSAGKELKSLELVDDRASLYYETVALDSSSDDEIEFMHVSGKGMFAINCLCKIIFKERQLNMINHNFPRKPSKFQ